MMAMLALVLHFLVKVIFGWIRIEAGSTTRDQGTDLLLEDISSMCIILTNALHWNGGLVG